MFHLVMLSISVLQLTHFMETNYLFPHDSSLAAHRAARGPAKTFGGTMAALPETLVCNFHRPVIGANFSSGEHSKDDR